MAEAMVQAESLVKIYKTKETEVMALQGLDLTIERGELTAIIGNSGSGKSTFLNMIGGLDRPTVGSLQVCGRNLFTMTEKELVLYKRNTVGFVGMAHKKNSRLQMLSGGEQQRIAIAIALANSPQLLLADEPTGSVDAKTADYIFDVFTELNKEGQTILIVTHDVALSRKVRRVVAIRDGKISSERVLKEKYADRLKESNIDWHTEETQEEFAIVDKAGRVQIPAELLKEIGLKDNKVSVAVKDGKVVLSRPQNMEDDTKAGTE